MALVLNLTLISWLHPYYVSVTELKKVGAKDWQLSVKVFADNMEDELKKVDGQYCDLLNEKKSKENEGRLEKYISNYLKIKVNGKLIAFKLIGFEKEEEAIWCYLEGELKEEPLKSGKMKVDVENRLLYEHLDKQVNIMEVRIGEEMKNSKVTYPESKISFEFQ